MSNGLVAAARPVAAPVARREVVPAWMLQLAFVAAHAPLAAIPKHSRLATYHALLVFGIGLVAAVMPRRPHLVACVGAYLIGAAVFWRMKAAPQLPWEFDKYAIVAIFVTALIFSARIRRPMLPLAYLALLLPSVFLTVSSAAWGDARGMLSFNLSGPIALAISVLFFSSVGLSPAQLRWLMTSIVAPIFGVAVFTVYNLQVALRDPEFGFYGGSSNPATSGGFGPNQVSATLGLGIVAIAIYLMLEAKSRVATGFMIFLMLFLSRQCLLTLSRGGAYMALGAVAAASFYLLRERAARWKLFGAAVVVGAILVAAVIPRLQELTGGFLVSRFEDTRGTGRDLLIRADMESWLQNPLLGVGPGLGAANRLRYFSVSSAHTEYTRMVAEHGFLGFVSLILLGAIAVRSVRNQRTRRGKAISAALLAYALLFMAVDAMRLAAPAFTFGLSGVTVAIAKRRSVMRSPSQDVLPQSLRAS